MSFLSNGDPNYKTRKGLTNMESTAQSGAAVKLRNFTEEQKQEIRERVKQIKLEREEFQMSQVTGHRFAQKRALLRSGGSQFTAAAGNASTTNIGGEEPRRVPLNPAKHILTLQKLSNISNYQELNSGKQQEDDFNPAAYGFDANPTPPHKLLRLGAPEPPKLSPSRAPLPGKIPEKPLDQSTML